MELKFRACYQDQMYDVKSINFNDQTVNLNGGDIIDLSKCDLMICKGVNDEVIYDGDILKVVMYDRKLVGYDW